MEENKMLNEITAVIIGAAIDVHRALGPGLLESAYKACLAFELLQRGLKIEQQKPLPIIYKDVKLDCGYRMVLLARKTSSSKLKRLKVLLLSMRHSCFPT